MRLVLSCEHGGNRVPERYAPLFAGVRRRLASHRGFDPGALRLARRLARRLGAALHAATQTRLLVDLNRSPGHPRLFSEPTRRLPPGERALLVARHYRPYRDAVEAHIRAELARGVGVLHLAVHSFTPVWQGRRRRCDVGLLYDPGRSAERRLALRWQALLRECAPELRVRRNQPYRGVSDGFTRWLRRRLASARYLGLELEVNQALLAPGSARERELERALERSLERLCGGRRG